VINALVDALSGDDGMVEIDMPATPDVVWALANRPLAAK